MRPPLYQLLPQLCPFSTLKTNVSSPLDQNQQAALEREKLKELGSWAATQEPEKAGRTVADVNLTQQHLASRKTNRFLIVER
jgi:hypothetical protein